jgi:hypothetical protein
MPRQQRARGRTRLSCERPGFIKGTSTDGSHVQGELKECQFGSAPVSAAWGSAQDSVQDVVSTQ